MSGSSRPGRALGLALALAGVFAGWALIVAGIVSGVQGGWLAVTLFGAGFAALLLGARLLSKHVHG